jgi:hypothetical protein
MATLQLEFNCLCLFVRDETNNVVHVLMPRTDHPGMERHVVRLYHPTFPPAPIGKSMEGLEWVLGPTTGSADFSRFAKTTEGEIVDVTVISGDASGHNGKKAPKDLVETAHHHVLTRVTLRAGKVCSRTAAARWAFKGIKVYMAHRVVWEIDDVPDILTWNSLNHADPIPLVSLADLGPETILPVCDQISGTKMGHRLEIYHTTPEGLPPDNEGQLDETAVRRHFRHYYELIGHSPIKDEELPYSVEVPLRTFNCGVGQALLDE